MFNRQDTDPSWQPIIKAALSNLPEAYLKSLEQTTNWLPGPRHIFNAFRLPVSHVRYVLMGESPYPRADSAIGYAFWDGAVGDLWTDSGLSKAVNRATSLRNFIKMLLIAEGSLKPTQLSQAAIAKVDHSNHVQTLTELFENLLAEGFLLLNASLVLSPDRSATQEAKLWQPFMRCILKFIAEQKPKTTLLLWGNPAKNLSELPEIRALPKIEAEHPYNISFISNPTILKCFKPLHLLEKRS